jgi:hypothetical protein
MEILILHDVGSLGAFGLHVVRHAIYYSFDGKTRVGCWSIMKGFLNAEQECHCEMKRQPRNVMTL